MKKKFLDSASIMALSNAGAAYGRALRGEPPIQVGDIRLPKPDAAAKSSISTQGGPKDGAGSANT